MRVMIFGCPHLQSGVTLGSAALPQTVAWLLETARNNSVTHIVCLGDTVDSVSKTDLIVNMQIKWTLDQFKTLAAQGVYTCWMIGNHDVYSDIYSGLDIFDQAANFNLVKNPTLLGGDDAELVLWPFQQWMDDPLQWRERTGGMYLQRTGEKPRILFTHCPIEGMPMGGTKDKGVDLKELALNFDMLFAGHYHQSNQFMAEAMSAETPVAVPGSVMGHDFKDLGWFHGALIWDYMPGSTDYPS